MRDLKLTGYLIVNRRKKIVTKLHKSNKPSYVSKAEREKLAEQESNEPQATQE